MALGGPLLGQTNGQADPAQNALAAARDCEEGWVREFVANRESALGVCAWSYRLMRAEQAAAAPTRVPSPAEGHVQRCSMVNSVIKRRVADGIADALSYLAADYYLSDALVALDAEKPGKSSGSLENHMTLRVASARLIYNSRFHGDSGRRPDYLAACDWSYRLLEAEIAASNDNSKGIAAARGYLERAREIQAAGDSVFTGEAAARERGIFAYYVVDAELLTLRKTAGDAAKQKQWERERLSTVKRICDRSLEVFRLGRLSVEEVFEWSGRWLACLLEAATSREARLTACEAYLARMKEVRGLVGNWFAAGRIGARDDFASQYFVAEAEIRCRKERGE